jgi:hypothetical protein
MSEGRTLVGTPREWAIDLAVITVVGVFLGLIGPFGSYNGAGPEVRIAFWVGNMWIGFLILATTMRLSIRVALRTDTPVWFAIALGVAIGALPLTLILSLFSGFFWPPAHGRFGTGYVQYGQALVMSEPLAFCFYYLMQRDWPKPAQAPSTSAPSFPASSSGATGFLDRLPPRLGRELLCLKMEDHYVRAHTTRGSDLILTPLKDAVAELGDEGLQVHRSWWVARRAVSEPVARGRNLYLRLSNGLDVPVSRASVAKLRAAGWLEPSSPI